ATARLVESLRTIRLGLQLSGLGGPRLKALGQQQLAEPSDLAVLGFWEVVKRYGYFRDLMHRAVATIAAEKPSALLLVDYPGFNLRLAKRVRKFGIPIIYYISPQVWAWGHKRIAEIRELVDLMIVILPFEQEFYRQHDIKAEFVGHYLLEDIPPAYISSPIPRMKQIALLPGSRPQEIERMLAPMLAAADQFNREYGTSATVAAVRGAFDYESAVVKFAGSRIRIEYDNARRVIFDADLVVTASGTATLETGIIGRPMVVVYKTGGITYQIAKRLIKIDKIGLVNLVLGEKVVPELIQDEVSPAGIVGEMRTLWTDQERYEKIRSRLMELPSLLHGQGASDRAAALVSRYL
ncbi:MAG: lipid-A-disaccharide synthase, partial [candidate division Zixibacteria bacterium]|nr:lipid-A-disaccharide synthase [candidate division Zixibacteria bacterium]